MTRLLPCALLVLPSVALAQGAPTTGVRTFAAEDVPTGYDEDHNDVVLRYDRRCVVNASDALVRETLAFTAVAAGAAQVNELSWTLPAPADEVWLTVGDAAPILLPDRPVVLSVDFRDAFLGSPSGFVNTETSIGLVPGVPHLVEVVYAPGTEAVVPASGPCPDPDLAIREGGTGAVIDITTTVGANDRPLAGRFTSDWPVPTEKTSIADAYADFLCWVVTPAACPTWFADPTPGRVIDRGATGTNDLDATAGLADHPSCGDGVQNQGETGLDCGDPAGVCPACAPAARTVFVTNAKVAPTFGGLAGADALCQSAAEAGGLATAGVPVFKAWLSDSTTAARDRLVHSTVPYVTPLGATVADDWDDLLTTPLATKIEVDEYGALAPYTSWTWTGTAPDGSIKDAAATCGSWSSTSGQGWLGLFNQTGDAWTAFTPVTCDGSQVAHLYCFEQ